MIDIHFFTFNPFQVNTYILFDETKQCVIVDPGCYGKDEEQVIIDFINSNHLLPIKIINTHCHVDHVLGNAFLSKYFNINIEIHNKDLPLLNKAQEIGVIFGLDVNKSPEPSCFLQNKDSIQFGNSFLEVLHVPGHSQGHIALFNPLQEFIMVGDVLFQGSIGRTDFSEGDFNTLINSIKTKILPLGNNVKIFSGHGPSTRIDIEKSTNPFLQ